MKRSIYYNRPDFTPNTIQDASFRSHMMRNGEECLPNACVHSNVKKVRLVKIAATVLIGFALSLPGHAGSDKYSRSSRVSGEQSIQPVEVWMLDPDYLSKESAGAIEPWMLEPGYLNTEPQLLESWMFAEKHLSGENIPVETESWMFEVDYLKNKISDNESIEK